jgi:anti-sigma B factor antagonist
MEIVFGELEGFKTVALTGRLDSAGVQSIELSFSAGVVPAGVSTLVDMSGVEFLASLGVRMLLTTARALSSRGARLVMFAATPAVVDTIVTMGFDDIVPLAGDQGEALALLQA